MSSAVNRPFGESQPHKSRQQLSDRAVFRLKVEGTQVRELVDFLELTYQTKVAVSEDNGTVLFFTTDPHRTAAGIRFGLSTHKVTLHFLQEW